MRSSLSRALWLDVSGAGLLAGSPIINLPADDESVKGLLLTNATFSTTAGDGLALLLSDTGAGIVRVQGTAATFQVELDTTPVFVIANNGRVGMGPTL